MYLSSCFCLLLQMFIINSSFLSLQDNPSYTDCVTWTLLFLFYSASLEHHSAFLPTQETLSSHFSNTHFFSFNKSLACFTVFLEHRVRSSCYFFSQLFIPKYIPCYFTLEAYIIFFHP